MSTLTTFPVAGAPREVVGTTIKMLLVRAGQTQTDLALAMQISQSQLSKRIRGTIPFDLDELAFVADYFSVPVGALFGEPVVPRPGGGPTGGQGGSKPTAPYVAPVALLRAA